MVAGCSRGENAFSFPHAGTFGDLDHDVGNGRWFPSTEMPVSFCVVQVRVPYGSKHQYENGNPYARSHTKKHLLFSTREWKRMILQRLRVWLNGRSVIYLSWIYSGCIDRSCAAFIYLAVKYASLRGWKRSRVDPVILQYQLHIPMFVFIFAQTKHLLTNTICTHIGSCLQSLPAEP
jgi:hypothetical protein